MADVIQFPVQGLIAYFNLADWWLSAFSPEERDWIESEHSKGTLTIGQANPRPGAAACSPSKVRKP